MKNKTIAFLFGLGLVAGIQGQAQTANLNVVTFNSNSSLFGLNSIKLSVNGSSKSVGAGQFEATFVSGQPIGHSDPFLTFCMDIGISFNSNVHWYKLNDFPSGGSPNTAGTPDWVGYGGQRAAYLYDTFGSSISSDVEGAGLQLAIWEVLYDTDYNLYGSGSFHQNSNSGSQAAAVSQAQSYLDAVSGNSDFSTKYLGSYWDPVKNLNNFKDSQAILADPKLAPIPEPSQVLALFAAAGFGIWRRFRKA